MNVATHSASRESTAAGQPRVIVGDWELLEPLALGARYRVHRARPAMARATALPAAYAVKLLDPAAQHDAAAIDGLRREARVARDVRSPHVAPILACQVSRPPYHVVMPLIQAPTLAQRLAAGERFVVPVALWIARQIATALADLRAAGWLHGDVSSHNALVSSSAHVTLVDLEFATPIGQTRVAAERLIVGTPAYMAPERFSPRLAADFRGDLYGVGVILYELLAGRRPFEGENAADLARQHLRESPRDVRHFNPIAPESAAALARRLMAKTPLRRGESHESVIAELANLEIECFDDR